MKILYIIDQDIHTGQTSGIIHKIKGKTDLWLSEGHQVEILSLYSFSLYDSKLQRLDSTHSFKLEKHSKFMTLIRLLKSSYLMFWCLKSFDFDLIYLRTPRLYMPFTRLALKKYKVIMELNSDDVEEWKCNNKVIWIANNLTRHLFYSLATAFVSVSHELTERYKNFNKETITIGNGISVSDYGFVPNLNNEKVNICFIGSPGFKWHGIDKIKWLASKCPEFDFHFIGEGGKSVGNITYHGYLSKEASSIVISNCDVGISTMSLHTKNMNEASPLKSRQYLAQGLPIIYAYDDTDLAEDEEFSLKIPNTPDNVVSHLEEIKAFVHKCHGNSDLRLKARKFAEENLDVSIKEKLRLDFLKSVL